MKKVLASIVAVAGMAMAANAQQAQVALLKYEVSLDGVNWSTSAAANPGQQVQVRARVQYTGTGAVGGLAQIIFQPVVSNWLETDALVTQTQGSVTDSIGTFGGTRTTPSLPFDAPGVYGRFAPWGASANSSTSYYKGFVGTGANAGLMRISQAHITNWIGAGATSGSNTINNVSGRGGVNASQLAGSLRISTDPAFETSTDVVVFKFAFTLSSDTNTRSLTVDTPAAAIGHQLVSGSVGNQDVTWYTDTQSTSIVRGDAATQAATIRVVNVPAPASLALLGLGGLAVARRRR